MTVEVYFEDGQMSGQIVAREDAPPIIHMQTSNAKAQFANYGSKAPFPASHDIDDVSYHRERAPHRVGCISYWVDEGERDRAAVEDSGAQGCRLCAGTGSPGPYRDAPVCPMCNGTGYAET